MNAEIRDNDRSCITILDNQYATLWYYPDDKIVHHQFHKFTHSDALRHILNSGIAVLKEHSAQKWLSDDRHHSAITPEDVHWAQTVWFPQAVEAGWKYWAIISPISLVGTTNLKMFAQQYAEQGVEVQFFTDCDEALAWLIAR